MDHTPQTYTCPDCEGSGTAGTSYRPRPCTTCPNRSGQVTIDPDAIRAAITTTRGANAGTFRRSRPNLPAQGGVYGAAYVWRMIRFYAGADTHLPIMAMDYIGVYGLTGPTAKAVLGHLDQLTGEFGRDLHGQTAMLRGLAAWEPVLTGTSRLAAVPGIGNVGNGMDIGDATDSPEAAVEALRSVS